jgi:hypothetical protein
MKIEKAEDKELVKDCSADYGDIRRAATRIILEKYEEEIRKKIYSPIYIEQKDDSVTVYETQFKTTLAAWQLVPFPSCEGIVISCSAYVGLNRRRFGFGKLFTQIREEIAAKAGYSRIMATTRQTNLIENHILLSRKWKYEDDNGFYMHRHSARLLIWHKDLENVTLAYDNEQ